MYIWLTWWIKPSSTLTTWDHVVLDRGPEVGKNVEATPPTHSWCSLMFSQLPGSLTSIELLYTLFVQCAKLSKIKPYDIRAMTSRGGVKSKEMVCVKDNLSSIVEGTHTHCIPPVLHRSRTHTEITFPPAVENEAVYQQPVIQIAHLQPQTHTYTHELLSTRRSGL